MKTVQGDLIRLALDGEFDVIIHGCNCFCAMGAGIAKSIKAQFPEAYGADSNTAKGDRNKLGSFSSATVIRGQHQITIVNAYSQYHWQGKGNKADYQAIKSVFAQIQQTFSGKRIAYPLIGAGLAGGDWTIISQIINSALKDENHTLVQFVPQ